MRTLMIIMILILSFSLYSCTIENGFIAGDDVKAIKRDSKSFDSSQVKVVEVRNSNGNITTEASDDDTIEIKIEKWATGHDEEDAMDNLDDVKVIIDKNASDKVISIEVRYSSRFGTNYGCDIDLIIPESIAVDLESSNGNIEIYGVRSDIDCHTSNGSITLEDTSGDAILRSSNGKITIENHYGDLDAETSNGQIEADIKLPRNGDCRLKTSNGSIKLYIPKDTSATLSASTSNSSIDIYDLDIDITQISKTKLKGILGDGDGVIILETSNGKITMRGSSSTGRR